MLLTVLAGMSLVAGCADERTPGDGPSREQYVAEGQAICRDMAEQLKAVEKRLERTTANPAAASKGVRKATREIRAGVRRLAVVPAPSELSAPSRRLTRALIRQARALGRLAEAIDTSMGTREARPIRRAATRVRKSQAPLDAAARETGLTECGS